MLVFLIRLAEKFKLKLEQLLVSGQAYNVRLIYKDKNHFRVNIDYQVHNSTIKHTFDNGAIGVDTNPDRIALANISKEKQKK